jgi:hypothetical protein
MLGQILADLAALGRDIGKAARRQEAGGGKETERMAAVDHGSIRLSREDGGDDADDIVVKQ